MHMFCVECGASNPENAKFCNGCGKSLIAPTRLPEPGDVVVRQFPVQTQTSPTASSARQSLSPFLYFGVGLALLCAVAIVLVPSNKPSDSGTTSNTNLGSAATASPAPKEPPLSNVTLHAYELFKDPYSHKNQAIILDVRVRPVLYNGSVISYTDPGADARVGTQLGLMGLRFSRMISEDTALYDIMGMDAQFNSDAEMLGQLAVAVPPEPT